MNSEIRDSAEDQLIIHDLSPFSISIKKIYMNTLCGIKNCDSVKKARKWLEQNDIEYSYHDFREHGIDKVAIATWITDLGWEALLNKRSTTWKQLSDEDRSDLDEKKVTSLFMAYPTLIKRPVLITKNGILVGFKEAEYKKLLNA